MQVSGAVEARSMLLDALFRRATARFVKLLLGPTPKKNPPKQLAARSAAPAGVVPVTSVEAEVLPPLVPARSQI